jgi:mRNA interferase MazF
VWWCETPSTGRRPVVVVSRDAAIPARRLTLVAPCTTTLRPLPTQVRLEPGEDPIPRPSVVNLDSIELLPLSMLTDRLGRLSSDRMHEVCRAIAAATGCAR